MKQAGIAHGLFPIRYISFESARDHYNYHELKVESRSVKGAQQGEAQAFQMTEMLPILSHAHQSLMHLHLHTRASKW